MIRLRNITIVLAALCALAVAAPAAWALDGNYRHVIRECYDTGSLQGGNYTRAALKEARSKLPSDIKEYSDCQDLINAALAAIGRRPNGGGGGGGGAGSGLPAPNPQLTTPSGAVATTQQDLDALKRATDPKTRSDAAPQIELPSGKLTPSTGGLLNVAKRADANSLPLPLILSIAGLAALALFGGLAVVRQRWPQTRRAALRLLGR